MSEKKEMKVATRLIIGFAAVATLGVAAAVYATLQLRSLSDDVNTLAGDRMAKVEMFSRVKDNMNAIARYARNIVIAADPAFEKAEREKIATMRADNGKLLAELDKVIELPEARTLLKTINDTRPEYNRLVDEALALDDKGEAQAAGALLMGESLQKQRIVFKAVDESMQLQLRLAKEMGQAAMTEAGTDSMLLASLAVLMAAIGAGVTWLIVRNLNRALGAEPGDLGRIAQRVAEGDLSPIDGAERAPRNSVLESLGAMQQSLSRIVAQVRASSDSIATGSSQIATGNADLSQRTEEQASNLQQTAASMEQLSSTVKQNAETAQEANRMASSAAAAAARGGEMVGNVVHTMQEISHSSKRIAEIIGVIDGIAFQTNILALNAAVEAARAGEQGRGFAVVAGEVRSLAQRCAQAAREIKSLIGASVETVDAGVRFVGEAGSAMHEVVAEVQNVARLMAQISAASAEQTQGIGQVNDAVADLDRSTQENSALVEENAAATDSLRQQAGKLVEVASRFRLAAG